MDDSTTIQNPPFSLTSKEKQTVLVDWNKTETEYEKNHTIHQLFETQAKRFPQNTALHFAGATLSYQELNEKANQLAHFLRAQGVSANDLIAFCLEPSFDLLICILGILKAGCAYVPLDTSYPGGRLQIILEDTNAKLLLTQSSLQNLFSDAGSRVAKMMLMDTQRHEIANHPLTNPESINHTKDLAYVIYTSGSTGTPKGVLLTHANVHHFIHWFSKALTISPSDIFDFSSSIAFDFSVATTLFPLTQGAQIAISSEFVKKDPALYIKHLVDHHVTHMKITPSHFRQFKEFVTQEHTFADLRAIIFGGESLYAKDIKKWMKQFPHQQIYNEYGPTEASVATSWFIVTRESLQHFAKQIPIGKPVHNSQLYILDRNLQPVGIGNVGELFIGGEGVALGYLNRPEMTKKKFITNPFGKGKLYKTGDLCHYLPDGNIEFNGRVDHQIKIRGFRIETTEIEKCLLAHPAINEAIVIVYGEEEKKLIAYCVASNTPQPVTPEELHQYLLHQLPEYMVPGAIQLLDALPLTKNGKVDRYALPKPIFYVDHPFIEPRTDLERTVHKIWLNVLNMQSISINDNFFELGGHSLNAARIIAQIAKITNREVKLQDFYQTPTIAELAALVEQAKEIKSLSAGDSSKKYYYQKLPLTDMQFLFWLAMKSYSKSNGLNIVDRIRVAGVIDAEQLNNAFSVLLQTHPLLGYYFSRYQPLLSPQKRFYFHLEQQDLRTLSPESQEKELAASLQTLKKYNAWPKKRALILARLFYLSNQSSELHIALAHIVSDEMTPKVIWSDLSKFYAGGEFSKQDYAFIDYLLRERQNITTEILQRDIHFWQDYLHDVALYSFPPDAITDGSGFNTTYVPISMEVLNKLTILCRENRISITDCLSAAVGLALLPYTEIKTNDKNIVLNFVKSTRDDENYDRAVGFFVRTDLLKLQVDDHPDLVQLSKRVQQSSAETAPYQFCSSIVKFAYLFQRYWKNKKFAAWVIHLFTYTYAKIFPKLHLNSEVLKMYGRMFLAGSKQNFLVEINVFNNFVNKTNGENTFFNFPELPIKIYEEDKMVAKNVLDISFVRENNQPYLILSGNLTAEYREKIAGKIIKHLTEC